MSAWTPLDAAEHDAVWREFDATYAFRPSMSVFPGIREPAPSRTYAIASIPTESDVDEFYGELLAILRAGCPVGDFLYALDWQHECFRLDPHALDGRVWRVGLPDGDYAIFLSPDLKSGLFGHPWEWSWCAFGRFLPLVATGRRRMVGPVLRER